MTQVTYQQYQFTISNHSDNEIKEGYTSKGSYINLEILDTDDMSKYKTSINNFEDIENLPDFLQNMDILGNMMISALKKEKDNMTFVLIKKEFKIILNFEFKTDFFKIPFKIEILKEMEKNNTIIERKLRKIEMEKKELELKCNNMEKRINSLEIKEETNSEMIKFLETKFEHINHTYQQEMKNMVKQVNTLKLQIGDNVFASSIGHPNNRNPKYYKLESWVSIGKRGGGSNISIPTTTEGCTLSRGTTNKDLKGLSILKNLKSLTMDNATYITDISNLRELKNLQELNISLDTELKDYTPILALTNLEKLYICKYNGVRVSITGNSEINRWMKENLMY